jgi:hypothetical protein
VKFPHIHIMYFAQTHSLYYFLSYPSPFSPFFIFKKIMHGMGGCCKDVYLNGSYISMVRIFIFYFVLTKQCTCKKKFFCSVLGIEPKALNILGKHSITELPPQRINILKGGEKVLSFQ